MTDSNVESAARDLARTIGQSLPDGTGFALVLFDHGTNGNLTYISSADREDMLRVMKALVREWEWKHKKGLRKWE